jgi:GT2 family glycosyltransferase
VARDFTHVWLDPRGSAHGGYFMTAAEPDLSVVIPTTERPASLRRLLESLGRQTVPAEAYEVIVCMDGSSDRVRTMLDLFRPPYTLRTFWQHRRGRAAACNVGIRAARGAIVVFLDDDMTPVPEFLAAHRSAHTQHTSRGVLGPVPIAPGTVTSPVGRYIAAKFQRHLELLARPDHRMQLRDFYSGNFSVRHEVLDAVGGFDEDFRIYGNEDLELFLRLSATGVNVVFSPAALAHQEWAKDFTAAAHDSMAEGRTAVLLATKHPQTFNHLKLATYRDGPRILWLARTILLALGTVWPKLPEWVIRMTCWLERNVGGLPHRYYVLAFGYFYWVGVQAVMREHPPRSPWVADLVLPGVGRPV